MSQTTTVILPDDVQRELQDASDKEGVSSAEFIEKAVRERLFLRRFRTLRQRLSAQVNPDGAITDEDIFDQVS